MKIQSCSAFCRTTHTAVCLFSSAGATVTTQKLNCLEYHRDSEFNIGLYDFVLLVAKEDDIVDGKLDTSKVMAFKAKAGDVVEVYATTLHYAPCNATKDGCFKVVIALPKRNKRSKAQHYSVYDEDKTLWACNKWLLAHAESNEAEAGCLCRSYRREHRH